MVYYASVGEILELGCHVEAYPATHLSYTWSFKPLNGFKIQAKDILPDR